MNSTYTYHQNTYQNISIIYFSYYRGCHGVIIVFDVTDPSTYRRVEGWITDIEVYHIFSDFIIFTVKYT